MLWLGKHKRVKCPDGRIIYVYRDPNDAYPLEARQLKLSAEGQLEVLGHAAGKAGLGAETIIGGLYLQLDEANRSMQAQLAAVYKTYAQSPCDHSGWLKDQVAKILAQESELRRVIIEIQAVHTLLASGASGDGVNSAIARALDRMRLSPAARQAQDALGGVPELARKWSEPTR